MSMQCLSSTNEAFLSQKTDLIAELKMSKDINGIRKLKVEKAKMEGSYDKEAYLDITKQFTATHFVEQVNVCNKCVTRSLDMRRNIVKYFSNVLVIENIFLFVIH